VRITEPSYLPVVVEVSAEAPSSGREELRERIAAGLARSLDLVCGGDAEFSGNPGLNEELLRAIISSYLGENAPPGPIKVFSKDGQPLPSGETNWPPDQVIEIIGVKFADDGDDV